MEPIPIRPQSHIVGTVGQTSVALQLQKWGWLSEPITADYGEDLLCEIFINNKRTALHFRCQVKSFYSNNGQIRQLKNGQFSVPISKGTLNAWANSYYPIIIAIYDEKTDSIYWDDVTTRVKEKVRDSHSKTVSLRVSKNELSSTRVQLESSINRFYSKLFSLEAPEFKCKIFPVFMPEYRSLTMEELFSSLSVKEHNDIKLESLYQSFELLPSWLTAINNIRGDQIYGLSAQSSIDSLENFFDALEEIFIQISHQLKPTGWISFIVSPAMFQETSDTERNIQTPSWNKQLSDWSCFHVLKNKSYDDSLYAFEVPNNFKRQIARHARSWDGYYYINLSTDFAIQIITQQAATPVYQKAEEIAKQQLLGQFLPWKCKVEQISKLRTDLSKINLIFVETADDTITVDKGWIKGIISNPMFSPEHGLIPQSSTWEEFKTGSIKFQIGKLGGPKVLSGCVAEEGISQFILSFFESDTRKVQTHLDISEPDYISGMPLFNNNRKVLFQKFTTESLDNRQDHFNMQEEIRLEIIALPNKNIEAVEVYIEELDLDIERIYGITIELIPSLFISTQEFIGNIEDPLFNLLNSKTPFKFHRNTPSRTVDILKLYGSLYFEGDNPWGRRK